MYEILRFNLKILKYTAKYFHLNFANLFWSHIKIEYSCQDIAEGQDIIFSFNNLQKKSFGKLEHIIGC